MQGKIEVYIEHSARFSTVYIRLYRVYIELISIRISSVCIYGAHYSVYITVYYSLSNVICIVCIV